MFGNHQAKILQEEIKMVHETYKKKVIEIDLRRIDGLRELERYDDLFGTLKNERKRLIDANLRLARLNEQTEKDAEGWKSSALRYQYLFEQMERVGLQQSEDIFECYKDIELPRISIREKNTYVTTHLTGSEIVDEIEENIIYEDDDFEEEILSVIERISLNIDVVDDTDDLAMNPENDPTVDFALNALELVNNEDDDYEDNDYEDNDFNDYDDFNEYDGLGELFKEDNDENMF